MASFPEARFDSEPSDEEIDERFDALVTALERAIEDFMDEHGASPGVLSPLLLRMTLTLRMSDYATSVEKPSGAGLKLELDRFRREVDEVVRDSKKAADEFVAVA